MTTVPKKDAADPRGDYAAWQSLTDTLPPPPDPEDQNDILWQQLAAHFRWYDRAATRNRLGYQNLKVAAVVTGAAVTVLAAIGAPAALTAALAALIVIMEGVQQVFQFHANWISYRATAEILRQHAFLYVANVEPYANKGTRRDRRPNSCAISPPRSTAPGPARCDRQARRQGPLDRERECRPSLTRAMQQGLIHSTALVIRCAASR